MEVLKDKKYKSYNYLSRYSAFPTYYDTIDGKYMYGTTAQLEKTDTFVLYTIKNGDSFDSISLDFYNTPLYWWAICDFNSIQNPLQELEAGTKIRIPTISNIRYK